MIALQTLNEQQLIQINNYFLFVEHKPETTSIACTDAFYNCVVRFKVSEFAVTTKDCCVENATACTHQSNSAKNNGWGVIKKKKQMSQAKKNEVALLNYFVVNDYKKVTFVDICNGMSNLETGYIQRKLMQWQQEEKVKYNKETCEYWFTPQQLIHSAVKQLEQNGKFVTLSELWLHVNHSSYPETISGNEVLEIVRKLINNKTLVHHDAKNASK